MMNRLFLMLYMCLLTATAQTITHGPLISNITHSTVRVTFITKNYLSESRVHWGPTQAYGNSKAVERTPSAPYANTAIISGLTPGTVYHLQVNINNGDELSPDVTFTTEPEPAVHPAPPAEPIPVDVSMPSGEYGDSSPLAINSECSNISTVLSRLAALSGPLNYEVVVPAGATCAGQFLFPARPNHSGWVVVRSDKATTASFPPEGVRWTKDWLGTTAAFVTNSVPIKARGTTGSFPNDSTCYWNGFGEGAFYHLSGLPTQVFPIMRCSDDYPVHSGGTWIQSFSGATGNVTVTAPGHALQNGQVISIPTNGYLHPGKYIVYNVSGDTFQITPGSVIGSYIGGVNFTVFDEWRQAPHRTGTSLPDSCSTEEWFWNIANQQYYWCTAPNVWTHLAQTNPSNEDNVAAIRIYPGASRYRFIGIEVTWIDVPQPMPSGWDRAASTINNQGMQLLLVHSAGDDIIWDRCYIHGRPKPARYHKGMSLRGERTAVIESYFGEFQEWRSTGYHQGDSSHAIAHYDGGPTLIRNNYMEVAGINYFAPNTAYNDPDAPHDVTFLRNHFRKLPTWRRTDDQSTIYPNRHPWELKQGYRFSLQGNFFDYSWSGINQGATTLLTPRCSGLPTAVSISSVDQGTVRTSVASYMIPGDIAYFAGTGTDHDGLWEVLSASDSRTFQIRGNFSSTKGAGGTALKRVPGRRMSDIDISSNMYYQGTEALRLAGTDGDCSSFVLPSTLRVRFHNNLIVDNNIRSFTNGGRVDKFGGFLNGDFGARTVYVLNGEVEDLTMTHNTVYGARGNRPTMIVSSNSAGKTVEGFVMNDNIHTFDEVQLQGIRNDNSSLSGKAALDAMFRRDNQPFYTSLNNVMCCNWMSSAGSYPATYSWPRIIADIKWNLPTLAQPFDFRLRSDSPYLSGGELRASDSLDVGADIDIVEAKMGKVKNVRIRDIKADGAVLSYLAPDAQACTVEFGNSPAWGTGTRLNDSGGDRVRNVSLTGLTSRTLYRYRILCAVEQPSGAFRTR